MASQQNLGYGRRKVSCIQTFADNFLIFHIFSTEKNFEQNMSLLCHIKYEIHTLGIVSKKQWGIITRGALWPNDQGT